MKKTLIVLLLVGVLVFSLAGAAFAGGHHKSGINIKIVKVQKIEQEAEATNVNIVKTGKAVAIGCCDTDDGSGSVCAESGSALVIGSQKNVIIQNAKNKN